MDAWLESLPQEVAYGVVTALLLALAGWAWSRLRRGSLPSERTTVGDVQNVFGTVVQADTIHEVHVHNALRPAPPARWFPRGPLQFLNRAPDLATLDGLLERASGSPGPVVALLDGMHAVGKSAIGIHWINVNKKQFPDGVLYGDFSKRRHGRAVDVADVLGDFLRELGTTDIAVPAAFEDRRRMFERVTAGKRLLMLLDDVDQSAQALNTLPSGAGSVVLVISNWRLHELLQEGAEYVPLKPLDPVESRRVLTAMVGAERLEGEPEAVDALIEACAGLPLGLSVCGGLLKLPDRSVQDVATEVAFGRERLRDLSGARSYKLEPVFDFAYRELPEQTALLYRRLAVHPGADVTPAVVAALVDGPVSTAEAGLAHLYEAHLIDQPSTGRFRLHDIVLWHARSCAERDESEEVRAAALRRTVDWYCAAVRVADHAVVDDRLRLSGPDPVADNLPAPSSPREAFAWFEMERHNVLAALREAADREWDDRVWQIAEALWPLCASHKRFREWVESQKAGAAAGTRLADPAVVARMRSQLARAYAEMDEHAQAEAEMREAKRAAAKLDHPALQASILEFGGVCWLRAGDAARALAAFRSARQRFEELGNRRGVALQDYYSGWALVVSGQPDEALKPLERAEAVMRRIGDAINVGRSLLRRGDALVGLSRMGEARRVLEEACEEFETAGIWFERAQALERLSDVEASDGRAQLARERLQQSYRIYREFGHPRADQLLARLQAGSP